MEPLDFNLYLMLRSYLNKFQLYAKKKRQSNLEFFTLRKNQSTKKLKVLNKIGLAWKNLLEVAYLPLICQEE